jgi:sterol desaturase/sphingolipid hydroxylase (fatty acid hydroxylase superfamily)
MLLIHPGMAVPADVLDFMDRLRAAMPDQVVAMYVAAMRIYSSPWFYLLIAGILLLEIIWPAVKSQRVFSRALAQDFLWFNLDGVFKMAILPAYIGYLRLAYDRLSGGFAFNASDAWPVPVTIVTSFLLSDFLNWFHHWVRHKVTVFWHFHVIHHSQRQMNLFTDLRVHSVEYVIAQAIMFVPLFLFPLSHPAIMGYGAVMMWYTRLIHANVRTNFGPLRFVLVSPQFHRIHHSIEPRHRDRNFGVILTTWDRLFGTLYPRYDEYPETGVDGVEFPPPARVSMRAWMASFGTQLLYPFRQLRPRKSSASN